MALVRKLMFTVYGVPQPAGSKTAITKPGRKTVIVDGKSASAREAHRTWRTDVAHAALAAMSDVWEPITGPVALTLIFRMPVPKSIPRKLHGVARPTKRPDATKLLRSTEDALTVAGVWLDDSQVIRLAVNKLYAWEQRPGATVLVEEVIFDAP